MTFMWGRSHRLAGAGSFPVCTDPASAFIDVGSAQDDPVIAHRFGRYLLDAYSKQDEPCPERLPHFTFGDGNQDVRLAWSEGAGMFLGASVTRRIDSWG